MQNVFKIQTSRPQLCIYDSMIGLELQASSASSSQLMYHHLKIKVPIGSQLCIACPHLYPSLISPPPWVPFCQEERNFPLVKLKSHTTQLGDQNSDQFGGLSQLLLHDIGHLFISKRFATLSLVGDPWKNPSTMIFVVLNSHCPEGWY